MHECMYQNQKIKSKQFYSFIHSAISIAPLQVLYYSAITQLLLSYSHKTVTLMKMNNIGNTVICKNKATQKGESR